MKILTSTLTAAQKSGGKVRVKVALTFTDKTSYTFYNTDRVRTVETVEHDEQPYHESAIITLNNSDQYFTDIELQGYKVVISYGYRTSAGDEYSDSNHLYVMGQTFDSVPGKLTCTLQCIGQREQMAEERADAGFIPTTETTKDLITAVMTSTMTAYDDQPVYTLSYDSEDDLLDSFTPGQSFRILVNTTRQAALSRLLMYTKCVARPEDDGKIHIFLPTTTGTTYNYEYALTGDYHRFLTKSKRRRVVIPNWIKVTDYEDTPTYSGEAKDQDSIDDYRAVYQYEKFYTLASDDEADDIAAAILQRYQMNAEAAGALVPMNVGAEIYDYVKITDAREGDTAVGNIGYIHRRFSNESSSSYPNGRFEMTIGFGGWLNMRRTLSEIDSDPTSPSDRTLDSLQVKYILADHIDFTDVNLDVIEDGTTYQRTLSAALDATGLVLLDETVAGTYGKTKADGLSSGYPALDKVADGTTYKLVKATEVNAGRISLTATNYYSGKFSGEWYSTGAASGVDIDATYGINIYGKANALTTRATKTGTVQCYMGADGCIYAGAGTVKLSALGLTTYGTPITLKTSGDALMGTIGASTALDILAASGIDIKIYPGSGGYLWLQNTFPSATNTFNLGAPGYKWNYIYRTNESACELPTSNSALDIFRKIKKPKVKDGEYGKRHYFEDKDMPEEIKYQGETEFTRLMGVTTQTIREIIAALDEKELLPKH